MRNGTQPAEQGDLFLLIGDLFQRLELLQPHSNRGFPSISLAVLSSDRLAAVSSRRRIRLAGACFSAVTTWFRISRMSPGGMMSLSAISLTGQDFLPGHLDRLAARFEHVNARHRDGFPEPVSARPQITRLTPVNVEQSALAFFDGSEGHAGFAAQSHQPRQ